MEGNVCDTNNLLPSESQNETDNTNLNEATPAVPPIPEMTVVKDPSPVLSTAVECDDAISSTTPDKFEEQLDPSGSSLMSVEEPNLSAVTDADFFAAELSMSSVPVEKITENVEDIVQDLENLLGGSNDSYRFGRESFENSKVSQSYNEVNSSNMEDLVEASGLFRAEENTTDNVNLDSTLTCSLLPEENLISNNAIDNELNQSIPSEVPVSTEELNIVDNIDEVAQMPASTADLNIVNNTNEIAEMPASTVNLHIVENIDRIMDVEPSSVDVAVELENTPVSEIMDKESFAEDTEKMDVIGGSDELANIAEKSVSFEVTQALSEICTDDANMLATSAEEITEAIENLTADTVGSLHTEVPTQVCDIATSSTVQITTKEVIEEENIAHIKNNKHVIEESNISNTGSDINIEDEVPQVSTTLNQEFAVEEQPQENVAELFQELENSVTLEEGSAENLNSIQEVLCEAANAAEEKIMASSKIKQNFHPEAFCETGNIAEDEAENIAEDEAANIAEDEAANIAEDEAENIAEDEAANIAEGEAASVAEGEAENIAEGEAANIAEGKETESNEIEHENQDEVTEVTQEEEKLVVLDKAEMDHFSHDAPKIIDSVTFSEESKSIVQQEVVTEMEEVSDEEQFTLPTVPVDDDNMKIINAVEMNGSSVNFVPENKNADENKEQLLNVVEEDSTRNADVVQPLTVEVEDPDVSEASTEISSSEQVTNKDAEVVEVIETVNTSSPVDKISPIGTQGNQSNRAPLKMTIAKHKSDNAHSILKIYDPNESISNQEQEQIPKLIIKATPSVSEDHQQVREVVPEELVIPKITIKPVLIPPESHHSPKLTIKPIKPPVSCEEQQVSPKAALKSVSSSSGSPRITIKPVVKPEALSPLKLTLRPYPKVEDVLSSPKLNIKPIVKPLEESPVESHHSPKITIKPIIKPPDEVQNYTEERHSPRITIKPIIKPAEEYIKSDNDNVPSPRITIKPVVKPQEDPQQNNDSPPIQQSFKLNIKPVVKPAESSLSPKITIKPVPKPAEVENESIELIDFEDQIKQERIVLKIAKNTKKDRGAAQENEKLKKIKLKFSKEGRTAHIVPATSTKRSSLEESEQELKYFKADSSDLTISLVSNTTSIASTSDLTITRVESISSTKIDDGNVKRSKLESYLSADIITPLSIESIPSASQAVTSSVGMEELPDPLADIPVFEITLQTASAAKSAATGTPSAPRKRGRPRKVPLEVREEFKDLKEEETPPPPVEESTRPKRSCRGASARATLGIKPRKPRTSTRGRGGKRTVSTRASTAKKSKERKTPGSKSKLPKESMLKESDFKEFNSKDVEFKQVPLPMESTNREVVIYEEETRMSAENSSRAQTPAKQVLTSSEVVEESQSSIQSNTTTESGEKNQKSRKGPRLEVHQEPEGEVISADKLAEYSWGGGGPYMLQEQVAQFLGIKSFKRKYPGIQRRPVDMQERDFIRESCLASEAMCDMGLTAVRSEDILDIMYTDFQNKYEEYCKHQRDRQAKDVSNKQKALSLAASQEKNKLDIVEQAVQSAFQWNANFNKARREQRRACMDLQTFTVHYPKGKMKQVNKPPAGHYPLALVPGQFTDYYKKYSPFELSNLPLNSMGCKSISMNQDTEESQSDASGSDSDSSSSDSDSSCSGSSGAEDCKVCRPTALSNKKLLVH